jgi:rod shape determining protein RodA
MAVVVEQSGVRARVGHWFAGFDGPLLVAVLLLVAAGMLTMYSVGYDHGTRFMDHGRNLLVAFVVMFVMAQIPLHQLQRLAVPLYTLGVALLLAVMWFGITKKGAQRWLDLGVVVQPSEMLKIATPLMLAWWFQRREGQMRPLDFVGAALLLAIPVGLIARQPDLGTALLVAASGLLIIYFAGLPWRLILPPVLLLLVGIVVLVWMGDAWCRPELDWVVLRDYQKQRVCTLLNPMVDPLGRGFHTIQGLIAIGSGGLTGKGFMQGTQTHLEFVPERTTDFVFAGFAEEFGLVGGLLLLLAYAFLIIRGLMLASYAPTMFARLLAAAMAMIFLVYAFVNMGMVSGILPVVGVPLPFISYGGTAMVTLGMALGMLMSVARGRYLMQS